MAIVPQLTLIDADDNEYPLVWPSRAAIKHSGLGMPPVRHWTTRAPFQHGRSHWGYAIQPRVINLTLFSRGNGWTDLFSVRQATMNALNPANGPHKLRMTLPDNHQYELHDVWFNSGYELSSDDFYLRAKQIGSLQLVVNDPFWKWVTAPLDAGETRDADGRTCVSEDTFTTSDELTLPFTGPFLLGTTTAEATLTCTNDGGSAAKPVITITGGAEDWILSNAANDKELIFDGYSLADSETLVIDIPNKTATSSIAGDVRSYISGNYGTFDLDPGANAVTLWISGGSTANTEIQVCWFVELLGT